MLVQVKFHVELIVFGTELVMEKLIQLKLLIFKINHYSILTVQIHNQILNQVHWIFNSVCSSNHHLLNLVKQLIK